MNMIGASWSPADFCLTNSPGKAVQDAGELALSVYARACRTDFQSPGFCLINFGSEMSSHEFRAIMVSLYEQLNSIHHERSGRELVVMSAARFDQQMTTKPHRDGGPDESLLLLGYEPSAVDADLLMSDYSRCAFELGLSPTEFLEQHNPMFASGERLLRDFTTRIACFSNLNYQIVCINNSSATYSESAPTWQGVLHTATVSNPDVAKRRVVDSMMIASMPRGSTSPITTSGLADFVATNLIHRRGYDNQNLQDDR